MTDPLLNNLFVEIPDSAPRELFQTLLNQPGLRIERIVSFGQASPDGFWYEQETGEWVALLQGTAGLLVDGQNAPQTLKPGDFLNIPAKVRHRVAWTSSDPPAVWLAIHYDSPTASI